MRKLHRAIPLLVISLLTGCEQSSEGFSGTISLKGQPLVGVTVELIPQSGAKEGRLLGVSDKEGKFVAIPPGGGKASPGSFKVVVKDPSAVPSGRSTKGGDPRSEDPYNAEQKPAQNPPIPPLFRSEATSTMVVTVESGKPITIELQ